MLLSNSLTFKAFDRSFSEFEFPVAIREPHPFRAWLLSLKNFNTMFNLKSAILILAAVFAASSQEHDVPDCAVCTAPPRHCYLTVI
jgi:hypothetical protein